MARSPIATERRSAAIASTAFQRQFVDYCQLHDLQLWSFASAEAQVAAVADDIAYDAHDIDDGLRAKLFRLDDIAAVPLPAGIIGEIRAAYPGLDDVRLVHELIRQLIGLLIDDVVTESAGRLAKLAPRSADEVRRAAAPVGSFSHRWRRRIAPSKASLRRACIATPES